MNLYTHDIMLGETDEFSKQYNVCTKLWQQLQDESLSEEDRVQLENKYYEERHRLETGAY